jgi:hypothetical protein
VEFRNGIRDWARAQARPVDVLRTEYYPGEDPFDDSDKDWGFEYDARYVKMAVTLWENSGYARIPTLEEIVEHDPLWLADLNRMNRIKRFWKQQTEAIG